MRGVFGVLAVAGTFAGVPAAAVDIVRMPVAGPETALPAATPDLAADNNAARNLRAFGFASARTAPTVAVAADPTPDGFNWLLLLAGFGIVGLATRSRRTPPPVTA